MGRLRRIGWEFLHSRRPRGWFRVCGSSVESGTVYRLSWRFGASHLAQHLSGKLFRRHQARSVDIDADEQQSVQGSVYGTAGILSIDFRYACQHKHSSVRQLFTIRTDRFRYTEWNLGTKFERVQRQVRSGALNLWFDLRLTCIRFRFRFSPEATSNQGPHWLKNLYFIYIIELRALAKAASYLRQETFFTGKEEEDLEVRAAVNDLLNIIEYVECLCK